MQQGCKSSCTFTHEPRWCPLGYSPRPASLRRCRAATPSPRHPRVHAHGRCDAKPSEAFVSTDHARRRARERAPNGPRGAASSAPRDGSVLQFVASVRGDVAGCVSQEQLRLRCRDCRRDARVRQLLVGVAQPVTRPLCRFAFRGTLGQRRGEAFGATPGGHDFRDELLHHRNVSSWWRRTKGRQRQFGDSSRLVEAPTSSVRPSGERCRAAQSPRFRQVHALRTCHEATPRRGTAVQRTVQLRTRARPDRTAASRGR